MKLSSLILNVIFLSAVQIKVLSYEYKAMHIEVPVDHFSFATNHTFEMRYLISNSFWKGTGPIFFYTGNEADIETFAENTGFMWNAAQEFQALVVFAEHRYYGRSLPFGNDSFNKPEHLGYLTSSQALADFVYLIDYLGKFNLNKKKNPVIAFGGSYGGMLSAWLRLKYPASVIGAIASSAPLLHFHGLVSCEVFNRIITFVFGISDTTSELQNCPHVIKRSWSIIREITLTPEGRRWLSFEWNFCQPLKTPEDVILLIDWLEEVYGNLAMFNYPYETDFIYPLPAYPVKRFCEALRRMPCRSKPFLERLGQALNIYANFTGKAKCIDYSSCTDQNDDAWDFQVCTEMVLPMCSDNDDMFDNEIWNFTRYSEECYKKWKVRVTRPDLAVIEYGGRDLKTTSNIVFSNGLLDPWSGGGILHDVSDTVVALVIPDTAHHLDLRADHPADPPSVQAARKFHKGHIRKWLEEYYSVEKTCKFLT